MSDGIQPDPNKLLALRNLPAPRNVKELRSFYGLASYFRRFIMNFADITLSLSQLLRSSESVFNWGERQQESFEQVKKLLTSRPLLKLPTESDTTVVVLSTDASSYGIGSCLEQYQDGVLVPICYFQEYYNQQNRIIRRMKRKCWPLSVVSQLKNN
jgi:hypothetical protein